MNNVPRQFPKATKFLSETGMSLDQALEHFEEIEKLKAETGA